MEEGKECPWLCSLCQILSALHLEQIPVCTIANQLQLWGWSSKGCSSIPASLANQEGDKK